MKAIPRIRTRSGMRLAVDWLAGILTIWHPPHPKERGFLQLACHARQGTKFFQNIFSGVHITIMLTTTFRTYPIPYSKACDTFRPRIGQSAAIRTGLGGKTFVHFFKPCAMLNSLVRQFATEGRPACIQYGFRHAGFGESGGVHIAHRDVIKLPDDTGRKFVVKIVSLIADLGVYRPDTSLLVRPLRDGKRLLCAAVDTLRFNLFAVRQDGKVFQAKVDANATHRLASADGGNINVDHDVQEPVSARVLGEIRTVFDLAFWQSAAIEHAEGIAGETECIAFALQIAALKRNPSKVLLAAIAQIRTLFLRARLGVLLANRIDGAGVQAKFLAAAAGELIQVKTSMPATAKAQSIFLPVVTVVKNEIAGPALLVQQAVQRLHTVTIDKNHFCFFRNSSMARRISSETGTSSCSDSARSFASIGSGKKVFVRFIYTLYQYFNRKEMTALQSAPFTVKHRPSGPITSEQKG